MSEFAAIKKRHAANEGTIADRAYLIGLVERMEPYVRRFIAIRRAEGVASDEAQKVLDEVKK